MRTANNIHKATPAYTWSLTRTVLLGGVCLLLVLLGALSVVLYQGQTSKVKPFIELPVPRSAYVATASSSSSFTLINLVLDPTHIYASDHKVYSIQDYKQGFVWPDKTASVSPNESSMNYHDHAAVVPAPAWLPYPPSKTPPVPRVDFIMRTFSGYSPLTYYMLKSLEMFVPFKALGSEVIIVLDDNAADHHYAQTLPDYVTVYFESPPAFFHEWGQASTQTGSLGVNRAANGYSLGVFSNWVSDRYSAADYICILDPDMMFTVRGALPLMFDWDPIQHTYKPIWICRDAPEDIFVQSSYSLFNLSTATAPGCMFQLPVCIKRDLLKTVRTVMNEQFYGKNFNDYTKHGLDIYKDRDSDLQSYIQYYHARLKDRNNEANRALPLYTGLIPPSAFERTYMRMVNADLGHAVCQFCVWGSYILLTPSVRAQYSLHLQGGKPHSECSQIRVGTHAAYLVPPPKMNPAYYALGDQIFAQGVCRASPDELCLRTHCDNEGWYYPAAEISAAIAAYNTSHPTRYRYIPHHVLNQDLLYKWELQGMFADTNHDNRCRGFAMQQTHQLYEWIQTYDLMPKQVRQKRCTGQARNEAHLPYWAGSLATVYA